ncbi:YdcF family protein [Dyadobacter sp. CY323]|nr:YdcF family protein [Dyadobacter sp. CY323]
MPLSILLMLLTYGLITKNNKRRRMAVGLGLILLLLISNSFLVTKVINWWEPSVVNIETLDTTYDVGILLSGGLIASKKPDAHQPYLGSHGDRVLQTFQLYKAGKIKKILITGTSQKFMMSEGKGETREAAALLVKWGVRATDILFEEKARNTRENALYSARIIRKQFPDQRYLLITSAFHIRRSAGCFDKAGIKTAIFPADFYGGYNKLTFQNGFQPDPNAIADFSTLWHEVVGYMVYKIVGYC